MSDYKTVKIHESTQGCFKSLDELRQFMAKNLPEECKVEDIGTVEIAWPWFKGQKALAMQ